MSRAVFSMTRLLLFARILALVLLLLGLFASIETACGASIPEELS